jgi:hypothetical protein
MMPRGERHDGSGGRSCGGSRRWTRGTARKPWLRTTPDSEAGISTVVGAILVFGLLIVALVTIQVKFVPVWEHDKEAQQMRTTRGQFAVMKSDVDRLAGNVTSTPVTDPLLLGSSGGFSLFSAPKPAGTLAFTPSPPTGFNISTPQAHLLSSGSYTLYGGTETWYTLTSSGTVENILSILHMRLRIKDANVQGRFCPDSQNVTLSLTDADGQDAGRFVLTCLSQGSGPTFTFRYTTFAPYQSQPISVNEEAFAKQQPPEYQYVDVLNPELQFDDVVRATKPPFKVSLSRSHTDMKADYTMAYVVQTPDGQSTVVGETGRLIPNWSVKLASGSLSFQGRSSYYPQQKFILEHGGVILTQPEGKVFAIVPQFTASLVAGQVKVAWVLPGLAGDSTGVSGPSSATITFTPTGAAFQYRLTMPRLTATLATQHGELWVSHWTNTLLAAGLTNTGPNPQFSANSNATSATLSIFGLQSDPAGTVDDIQLTLKAATILTTTRG